MYACIHYVYTCILECICAYTLYPCVCIFIQVYNGLNKDSIHICLHYDLRIYMLYTGVYMYIDMMGWILMNILLDN